MKRQDDQDNPGSAYEGWKLDPPSSDQLVSKKDCQGECDGQELQRAICKSPHRRVVVALA
jgi:hypothetical protein